MAVVYDKLFSLMENRKMTNAEWIRQANISGNIVVRLRHNEYVSLETVENLCRVFECQANDILDFKFESTIPIKQFSSNAEIQNRRYLGNKFKLLDFIKEVVEKNCTDIETVADVFSGTGAVASAFIDKIIITNDLLYSNYLCNLAWFGSESVRLNFIYRKIF